MLYKLFKKCSYGFTLAEVLVTLGIIGVVSMLTMPSMIQNWQRESYVTQLKKTYSELSQSLENVLNDKKALNLTEAGLNDKSSIQEFTNKYFVKAKNCGDYSSGCFANSYRSIDNNNVTTPSGWSCFITSGGASICMTNTLIYIDINGSKGPNIAGKDLYSMSISDEGNIYTSDKGNSSDNVHYCKRGDSNYCVTEIINSGWEIKYQ